MGENSIGDLGGRRDMFKNWKTTIAGFTGGGLTLYAGGTDFKHILLALALAGLGSVAKDSNVTGGTVQQ
jgi:hypothetical protein